MEAEPIKVPESMQRFERKVVSLKELVFDKDNPNKMTSQQITALNKSIEKFGYIYEIVVDKKTMMIADGEHRAKTLLQQGITSAEVILFEFKDDIERRLFRQTANKLRGEHDKELDLSELGLLLNDMGYEAIIELLPNEEELLKKLLPEPIEEFDIIESLAKPPKYIIQQGEVWQLGKHRLMCGDANTADIKALIQESTVDVLLTDPPYGLGIVHSGTVGTTSQLGFVGLKDKPEKSIAKARQYRKIINDDKPFDPTHLLPYGKTKIIFGANNFSSKLPDSAVWLVWDKKQEGGLDHNNFSDVELMWTNSKKKACLIYRHLWSGLLRTGDRKTELKDRVHPTQKPVGLITQIINDFSQEGEKLLDPYGGSGSTLIACEKTNRKCYMMEIDPQYCSIIIERWEALTGKKAEKMS